MIGVSCDVEIEMLLDDFTSVLRIRWVDLEIRPNILLFFSIENVEWFPPMLLEAT